MLSFGGLAVIALLGVVVAFGFRAWLGQPVPVLGFEQTFEQPIDFPHTVHAGMDILFDENGNPRLDANNNSLTGAGLDCVFCHHTVTTESSAGIPALELCSACHTYFGAADNAGLITLREAAGVVGEQPYDIEWRRVHRLPDHVRFSHEPHVRYLTSNPSAINSLNEPPDSSVLSQSTVGASQVCSTCHGNIASMEQVFQVEPLKMGQCVSCHRQNEAPTDCATCHH